MPQYRLIFEEMLDLPESYDGPWSGEINPEKKDYPILYDRRLENFENILGYSRATTGGDPTESKECRHLILLENSYECRVHIQITQANLDAHNFDDLTLAWVDFD